MADLKSIANMQIGGPKYPKKRRINLYQKQTKKGKIAAELGAFAVFMVFVYGFSRFGVMLPCRRQTGQRRFMRRQRRSFVHWRNPTRCTVRSWQSTRIMEMGI